FGTKGWVSLSRNSYAASNPDWFKLNPCIGDRRVLYHFNYYKSFVNSVRERAATVAPLADALRSDAISHLSLMAIKCGQEVTWDPLAYKIKSPAALNEQMHIRVRGDWQQS
ncbi:MAG TPA: hypothetical protein VG347_17085, partial [Verrucomicrobiae bacterium]|nr:hypothetical protein [Verrucomicrobiae bacterium]